MLAFDGQMLSDLFSSPSNDIDKKVSHLGTAGCSHCAAHPRQVTQLRWCLEDGIGGSGTIKIPIFY